MRTLYLIFLVLELAWVIYDGISNDPSINKWLRVAVLVCGTFAYYCWIKGRAFLLARRIWQLLFFVVCGWFFIYAPFTSSTNSKLIQNLTSPFSYPASYWFTSYISQCSLHFIRARSAGRLL